MSFKARVLDLAGVLAGKGVAGTRPRHVDAADVRNILVVELWNIGDVVLLLPFLGQLRRVFPRARVALLARPHAEEILRGTGLVDAYIGGGAPGGNWLSLDPRSSGWRDLILLRRELAGTQWDLAFQCRPHAREHVILAMSHAKRRIGCALDGSNRLLTEALPAGSLEAHKAGDWVALLELVATPSDAVPPTLVLSKEEKSAATRFLAERGVTARHKVIGVHPGASEIRKRWPLENFAAVARNLVADGNVRVVAFADPAGYGASLGSIEGVVVATTGLRQLMALIERCQLLVCNDSGPMHLAAALGVPTVAIFDSRVTRAFSPLGTGHIQVQGSDIGAIPAERVLSALGQLAVD